MFFELSFFELSFFEPSFWGGFDEKILFSVFDDWLVGNLMLS
ncbi:hypothetical protein HMPREF1393_01699 [Helicobacter pylori GAM103Bi]|nr:hypothetical protein HMPREF1393_01699 [Helicobacter pylori GAM103Bi]